MRTESSLSHRAFRVGILGVPVASGNRGVQALGESLVRLVREAAPNAEVKVFGSDRTGRPVTMHPEGLPLAVELVCWRLNPKGGLKSNLIVIFLFSVLYRVLPLEGWRRWLRATIPWIGQVASMDMIGDVRGGDSFSDIYGMKRYLLSSLPIYSILWVKGGLVQFPQTYGPYRSSLARWIARDVLRRSSLVVARDVYSQKVAQDLLGDSKRVGLSPDVAFALHVRSPKTLELDGAAGATIAPGTIGVNVNGLMFHGGYTSSNQFGLKMDYARFVPLLLERLLRETEVSIVLVPHTLAPAGDVESDNEASRRCRELLPEAVRSRVRIVTGDYDAHEMKAVIGQCDFFVGSRMHSCIGALSQGVPCVGVAYSMKFVGVFESVGYGRGIVDARDFSEAEAVEKIAQLYRERDDGRKELGAAAKEAREKLKGVFSNMVQISGRSSVA